MQRFFFLAVAVFFIRLCLSGEVEVEEIGTYARSARRELELRGVNQSGWRDFPPFFFPGSFVCLSAEERHINGEFRCPISISTSSSNLHSVLLPVFGPRLSCSPTDRANPFSSPAFIFPVAGSFQTLSFLGPVSRLDRYDICTEPLLTSVRSHVAAWDICTEPLCSLVGALSCIRGNEGEGVRAAVLCLFISKKNRASARAASIRLKIR